MDNYQSTIDSKKRILATIDCDIPYYKRLFKRLFDIFFSLLGLAFLLPILIVVSIWIKISTKEKVFYKQTRMGKDLNMFYIYKFQTMVPNADKMGPLVTVGDDPRVTKPGKFLRKYKIDELPQLFNVLKGDMSFVGPRPEVPKYLEYYSAEHLKLFLIRPGITDRTSINLRNEELLLQENGNVENYYEKVLLPSKLNESLKYFEDIGFVTDIRTILDTLVKI